MGTSFALKLILVIISSLLVFAYMLYLQKKKEDRANKVFEDTMKRFGLEYDKPQGKKKDEK